MWSFSGGVTLKCCSSKIFFYKFQKTSINIRLRCYPIIFMSKKNPFHALPIYRVKTSIKIITKKILSTKWQWV